jgi:hypothetical protein
MTNNDAFFAPSYVALPFILSLSLSLSIYIYIYIYIYVIDVIGSNAEQHIERQIEIEDRPRRK